MATNPLQRRPVMYRVNGGACAPGYIDTADCDFPRAIYDPATDAVVVGAVETPAGDCPAEVVLVPAPPAAPVPITLAGQDCAGAALPATGLPQQLTQVVQPPGQVFTVRMCTAGADREMVTMCAPTGERVVVQNVTPESAPLGTAPTFEAWNLDGTAYTGAIADLVDCGAEKVDFSEAQFFCDGTATYSRVTMWDIATNPPTVLANVWQDMLGAVVPPPAGTVTPGKCEPARLVMNPVHWSGPATANMATPGVFTFDNYPVLVNDFPGTTGAGDLYVHGIEYGPTGVIYGTDGLPLVNPTSPVVWASAQAAVDAFLAAAGLPPGCIVLTTDGAGQPVVAYDLAVVNNGDVAWWAGTGTPDNYTNKTKAGLPYGGALPAGGVCAEGKAWYDEATGALVRVNLLDGTDVTATVLPGDLQEGACPAVAPAPPVQKIYVQQNTGTLPMSAIAAACGPMVQSITVVQRSGTGSLTGDAGGGAPIYAGQTVSWSAFSESTKDSLASSALILDAGGGEQFVTAVYLA